MISQRVLIEEFTFQEPFSEVQNYDCDICTLLQYSVLISQLQISLFEPKIVNNV